MQLTDQDRHIMIEHHLTKASKMLIEGDEMLALQHFDMACNRYYYACFHAVHALLLFNHLSAKMHEGLLSVFGKEFILTGKIDRQYGSFLTRMEQLRKKADYNCVYDVTAQEVETMQQPVHQLLQTIQTLLTN